MKNRNIAIGVGIIILLWWLSRKKDTVETMVDEATDGGGGGIGGGGFFPSFPIPPIDGGTGTGTTTPTGSRTKTSDEKTDAQFDPERGSKGAPPDDVVLQQTFTYTTGYALRPLRIKINANTFKTYQQGEAVEIAVPKAGNNSTHPKVNPSQTLLLGTDVDFSGVVIPKNQVTPPMLGGGALGGGGIQDVSPTGTTTSGSTIPRAGAIGSKSGGSTSAGKAPSGTL
jgi:hypothetical protein